MADMEEQKQQRIRKLFGFGRPGEAVPTVDPEDVKAVWECSSEFERENPGRQRAVGIEIFKRACSPGAKHPGDYLPHTDDVGGATRLSGSLDTLDQRGSVRRCGLPCHRDSSDGVDGCGSSAAGFTV